MWWCWPKPVWSGGAQYLLTPLLSPGLLSPPPLPELPPGLWGSKPRIENISLIWIIKNTCGWHRAVQTSFRVSIEAKYLDHQSSTLSSVSSSSSTPPFFFFFFFFFSLSLSSSVCSTSSQTVKTLSSFSPLIHNMPPVHKSTYCHCQISIGVITHHVNFYNSIRHLRQGALHETTQGLIHTMDGAGRSGTCKEPGKKDWT